MTSFSRYCKNIEKTLLLWVILECLIMPIYNDRITIWKALTVNLLKSTCKKRWYLSACKKIHLKTVQLESYARPKWYYQFVQRFCISFPGKKLTSQLHSLRFLGLLKTYANFLFEISWICLAKHTQNDTINLQKTSMC